jgi:SSS family solute:Na+ symporter
MMSHIGPIDAAVLLAYLGVAIAIGMFSGGRAKSMESFLLGDRDIPWWAILGSIVATETSAATVLSVPGESYGDSGMRFLQLALGYIVGRILIVQLLLPLYFRGKLSTAYEVLHERFGGATREAASLLFLVCRNLGDGLRLFLAAIVLQRFADVPFEWSMLIMGAISILYTFFGGIRSVVWNDCVQFLVYMAGAIAAFFVIASKVPGGWPEVWQFATTSGKLHVFNFSLTLSDPYTFWAGLIGGAVLTIGTHGTDHSMVQRYLSARSQTQAGWAIVLSGIVVFLQFALFLFIGIELACYYRHFPPEVKFAKTDEVFADFIVHGFPRNTGLIGLMLAAILSSTFSSSLSSSASAVVNDFYVPRRKEKASPEHLFWVSRGLTVVFGVLQIGIGIWAKGLDQSVVRNALTIAGFSSGLLLGVFALGALTRRTGQRAAFFGGAVGFATLALVQFVLPSLSPEYRFKVAFPWLALIGCLSTFVSGWLASVIFPRREPTDEPKTT